MNRFQKSAAVAVAAVSLVAGFEGLRTTAYRDIVGVPTVCFGETRGVKMTDKKTEAECKEMLKEGLSEFSTGLDRCLRRQIPDGAYVAVLSWSYNVGLGNACRSTLVKKMNAGDLVGGCEELMKWDRSGGFRIPGLTRRRKEEMDLCLSSLN